MCENCCAVARKLSSCARCCSAWYCSVACQKAAWKDHKPFCALIIGNCRKLGRAPALGVIDTLLYTGRFMRVRTSRHRIRT